MEFINFLLFIYKFNILQKLLFYKFLKSKPKQRSLLRDIFLNSLMADALRQ